MSPHRKHIDAMNVKAKPTKREYVEMVDGRVYYSDNNWATVYLIPVGGRGHQITGRDADLARFLAVAQSSGGPA